MATIAGSLLIASVMIASGRLVLAFAVVFAVWLPSLFRTTVWEPIFWFVVVGLTTLSYGFNNIPLPLGGVSIPLVDAMIPLAVLLSAPTWVPIIAADSQLRRLFILVLVISAIAVGRLIVDVPTYGVTAGRDALYVLEAWGLFLGVAVGRTMGLPRVTRALGRTWRLCAVWFMLYPFRDALTTLGPVVGVQRPTPLVAYNSAGFIAVAMFFWFLSEKRPGATVFAALSLFAVLLTQLRGAYLAVLITPVLIAGSRIWSGRKSTNSRGTLVRVGLVAGISFVALTVLPPLPGRLGARVSIATVFAQFRTLEGEKGPGSGSLRQRNEAWPRVIRIVKSHPLGPVVGVGYGPDLFNNFHNEQNVQVRKPHNDFLEIWARTGVLGLIPWLILIALIFAWSLQRVHRHPLGRWLIAFQAVSLVASFTQPFFGFAYGGLVYYLLSGLALALSEDKSNDSLSSTRREVPLTADILGG